jgi:guanylate cyclase soluble subunit beta
VLGAPVATCLEMFGEHWVLETASKSYDMLLDVAGHDMISFLGNINALHDRITSTFPDYVPPEFAVEKHGETYLIHYCSKRQGLTPFVVGLLKGLAVRFNTELTIVSLTELEVTQGAHTRFEIEISSK